MRDNTTYSSMSCDLQYPLLAPLPDGKHWRVAQPFHYCAKSGERFTVPPGTVTNLASIPGIFHSIIHKHGKHTPAAVLHDYLYQSHETSRKRADDLFLEAMKAYGVSYVERQVMYAAVRLFGGKAWQTAPERAEAVA